MGVASHWERSVPCPRPRVSYFILMRLSTGDDWVMWTCRRGRSIGDRGRGFEDVDAVRLFSLTFLFVCAFQNTLSWGAGGVTRTNGIVCLKMKASNL